MALWGVVTFEVPTIRSDVLSRVPLFTRMQMRGVDRGSERSSSNSDVIIVLADHWQGKTISRRSLLAQRMVRGSDLQ